MFRELLDEAGEKEVLCFSACRTGIFYYIDLFKRIIPQTKVNIFAFDNDHNMISNACVYCTDSNIRVMQNVIHSICSQKKYSEDGTQILLTCSRFCHIIFLRDAAKFKSFFNIRRIFIGRERVHFNSTDTEDDLYIKAKLININLIHTVISMVAYVRGYSLGKTIDETKRLSYNVLGSTSEYIEYADIVLTELGQAYIRPLEKQVKEPCCLNREVMYDFIDWLMHPTNNEQVLRGLDPNGSDFASKMDRHLPLLEEIENEKIKSLIREFRQVVHV